MSTVTRALGSLIISVVLGWGLHTSMWAQSPPSAPEGGSLTGASGSLSGTAQGVPTVPPLPVGSRHVRVSLSNAVQILDGLNCEECVFEDMTFTYSGGEYQCERCVFLGTIRFDLQGAAQNTLTVLELAKTMAARRVPAVPIPLPPQEFTTEIPLKATWTSQR
jgi:hypothetical protein